MGMRWLGIFKEGKIMNELIEHLQAMIDRLATTSSDPAWLTDDLETAKAIAAKSADAGPTVKDVKSTLVLKTSNIERRDAFAMTVMRERLPGLDGTDAAIEAMWVEAYRIADIGDAKGKPLPQ